MILIMLLHFYFIFFFSCHIILFSKFPNFSFVFSTTTISVKPRICLGRSSSDSSTNAVARFYLRCNNHSLYITGLWHCDSWRSNSLFHLSETHSDIVTPAHGASFTSSQKFQVQWQYWILNLDITIFITQHQPPEPVLITQAQKTLR